MRPASSGQVLINGLNLYDSYDSFRSMIGYVPQDDIIHLELTVTEVLTYSARLRMPDDTTEAQIAAAVDEVLSDLELTVHRYKYVMSLCVAMMIFTAIMLGASNSSREIVKEQAIYRRERLVNLRVTPYLLSKVTVLSGVCLVQTLLLVTVVTMGLNLPAFWTNVGAFFLVYIVSI